MTDKYKFDAARARKGHPVQFSRGSLDDITPREWVDVNYIGPDVVRGGHIVQFSNGEILSTSALRMAPLMRKAFVNFYHGTMATYYRTEEDARKSAEMNGKRDPIAVAVPVEYEERP